MELLLQYPYSVKSIILSKRLFLQNNIEKEHIYLKNAHLELNIQNILKVETLSFNADILLT